MPPRRVLRRGSEGRHEEEIPQPPPNQDASACELAGMAQLLEQHVVNAARVRPEAVYEHFRRMNPEDFHCTTDPFIAEEWIRSLEVIFSYMDMANTDRIHCIIYLLKGDACLWWEGAERGVNLVTFTWGDFNRVFYDKYFTSDVRSMLKRGSASLRQGDSSVSEFLQKFDRGCHFFPLIANDDAEKLRHFLDGLRPTIRRDVMFTDPTYYNTVIAKAFRAQQ
ncbi:uncharacterized protein LOC142505047 [Primulina tabacum]|uniref:uncharacterized protein LOC142505047 n=1 Tax=Primulina tabacum TaxID=48773 RepID=UPI003F5ACF8D